MYYALQPITLRIAVGPHSRTGYFLVHERRAQGIGLPKLRYRWAAMNPCSEAYAASKHFGAVCSIILLRQPYFLIHLALRVWIEPVENWPDQVLFLLRLSN